MRRHEISDDQWHLIENIFPGNARRGKPWRDHRTVLNGMFWILKTGAPWRDLPERYGPWKTVYARFRRWTTDGTIKRILKELQLQAVDDGLIDFELWSIDGTNIRASRAAAGALKKGATDLIALLAVPEAGSAPRYMS